MKIASYKDIIFEIGQNAKENWEIFEKNKEINSDYVWFHLNSFPSSYVIMIISILELKEKYSRTEIDTIFHYGS